MILCFTGIAAIIGIHSEIGCLFLFVWCMLVHLFTGKAGKIMAYLIFYLALSGITWAGVGLLQNDATMVLGIALSNMGILGRKAVIPLSFASCLAKEPTGSLMAAEGGGNRCGRDASFLSDPRRGIPCNSEFSAISGDRRWHPAYTDPPAFHH